MEVITVFTPTYNRASLLERTYNSLKRQTNKNFIWLVVDDGSTDNTKSVVENWIKNEEEFRIEYIYKQNGGLQSGYVEAINNIDTELAMCVDSDDYLVDDAVESVLKLWKEKGCNKYAGILALDKKENGDVIGGYYPEGIDLLNLIELDTGRIYRKEVDKVLAVRTDLYKSTKPAKKYPNEKTLNATYLHLQIGLKHDFLLLNKPICVVEYQDGGISNNKKKQYFDRPNNFADWRIFCLGLPNAPLKYYLKNQIHYIAECIIAKRKSVIKDSPRKAETVLMLPFGFALWIYLLISVNK